MKVTVTDKARDYIRNKSEGEPEVTVAIVTVASG
jgi:hypothetical protein